MFNEQIGFPLIQRDLNQTFQFSKRASPYCQRIKEMDRRHSLLYSADERLNRKILCCQGATLRMDLKTRTAKPRQRTLKRINKTVNISEFELDITPWENTSP